MSLFDAGTLPERKSDVWLTPPWLLAALGPFDLDPCAAPAQPWPTAKRHISLPANGLTAPWEGRVWCNPPYGPEAFRWLARLAEHGDGIALVFARTETKGFRRAVWDKADAILFLYGRIAFHGPDGRKGQSAAAPSCLVAYGQGNVQALEASGLEGKLVRLREAA